MQRTFCSYCHNKTEDDRRGNCCACGAPRELHGKKDEKDERWIGSFGHAVYDQITYLTCSIGDNYWLNG